MVRMSLRGHMVLMLVATVIAWITWLLVMSTINPTQTVWWGFVLFYTTLFLSLFGSFAVAGLAVRTITQFRRRTVRYQASTSLRQALLWSLALIIALFLQSQRLLSWWVVSLLAIVFVLIEFMVMTMHHNSERGSL